MPSWGQDWASYQAARPATAGLDFAFVKATEGTGYTNPDRAAQTAHAHAAGLVVGQYHYPHMAADPVREADYFLKVAAPKDGELIALDWEGYDKANVGVPMSTQIAYRRAWLAHVQAVMPGHQVGTYCNTDYLARDPHGFYGDFLWIATVGRPAGLPGITHPWLFHQYSAAGVDRDYCPLTRAALATWATSKEIDMTPDQARQLADLHTALVPGAGWGYTNPDEAKAAEKAGARAPQAWDKLSRTDANVRALLTQEAGQSAAIQALAAQLGKGKDVATIVTAVQQAIADATVHVQVDVTGTATDPTAAEPATS